MVFVARPSVRLLAEEINARGRTHLIGSLQAHRQRLHKRQGIRSIFNLSTTVFEGKEEYAFHWGGRRELQFNIGYEGNNRANLRHAVAFSFETGRNLSWQQVLDDLLPRMERFNAFVALHSGRYADMRMWHYDEQDQRSNDYSAGPIPVEAPEKGWFIALGALQPGDTVDVDRILNDFDRLLPLYLFTEEIPREPESEEREGQFEFRSASAQEILATVAHQSGGTFDVELRHRVLARALHQRLIDEYGEANLRTEVPTGRGTLIDAAVRLSSAPDRYSFYEIKTASSARVCLREAIGQLLEYSFWPKAQHAERLVVVGQTALDRKGLLYLDELRTRFGLPIYYERASPIP